MLQTSCALYIVSCVPLEIEQHLPETFLFDVN
jgi:hypothetical protein